ncbi:N-acetylmuramoyl-L-alanine amidase-like domain-containing protein [Robiginitalea sediminis]|uniref:N-acetylmuramoyl-L-alanine amidase-like domain-containing protein n=1 Tax=Robiginitalea sediminis TaxID=1982593 RepID=UPI000B4A7524|nr:N-acetylmuramoyl-L-alanine amidase-like domain-containing protein [Robiginitalea sediminis]
MRHLFIFFFLVVTGLSAQHRLLHYDTQDQALFESLGTAVENAPDSAMGPAMVQVGKALLGTPYVGKTLEIGEKEMLVVNLRGLDCTTFVENALVMGRLAGEGQWDWDRYLQLLEQVRYRKGKLDGYASRLHYFTEWIRDNQDKGLVRNITEELYGVTVYKKIDFMGTHRELYPFLASDANFKKLRDIEKELSGAPLCILPREEVAQRESLLQDGDIIALATDIEGLDVTHTGLAVRMDSGRIHLLHASTVGEVVISEKPLADYLQGVKRNVGIIVARPLNP